VVLGRGRDHTATFRKVRRGSDTNWCSSPESVAFGRVLSQNVRHERKEVVLLA